MDAVNNFITTVESLADTITQSTSNIHGGRRNSEDSVKSRNDTDKPAADMPSEQQDGTTKPGISPSASSTTSKRLSHYLDSSRLMELVSPTGGGSGSGSQPKDKEKEKDRAKETSQKERQGNVFTDKLIERLITATLPVAGADDVMARMEHQKDRPVFSVSLMGKHVVQMLQRLSYPFEVIDFVIEIYSWKRPAMTFSIGAIITLLTLNPHAIPSSFLLYMLLFVMVPSYLARHKPEPTILARNPIPAAGPPLGPPDVEKPLPEFSREFYLNMTDLQNHMVLYIEGYNKVVAVLQQFAFFVDERVSSCVFFLMMVSSFLSLAAFPVLLPLIPVKALTLLAVWGSIAVAHPQVKPHAFRLFREVLVPFLAERDAEWVEFEKNEFSMLDEREVREVEVFELQKLVDHAQETSTTTTGEYTGQYDASSEAREQNKDNTRLVKHSGKRGTETQREWMFVMYSADPFTPLSGKRMLQKKEKEKIGKNPEATQKMKDLLEIDPSDPFSSPFAPPGCTVLAQVQPPDQWKFLDSTNWELDLINHWVEDQLVRNVEADDELKWVYDVDPVTGARGEWRRRRWVRLCVRASRMEVPETDVTFDLDSMTTLDDVGASEQNEAEAKSKPKVSTAELRSVAQRSAAYGIGLRHSSSSLSLPGLAHPGDEARQ